MTHVPGVSGRLLPGRYIADRLAADAGSCGLDVDVAPGAARQLARWWASATSRCGPATATAALVDIVAMPLFAQLGFRARRVSFDGPDASIDLATARGTPVAALVRPWATHPSSTLRGVHRAASAIGAGWGFVLAPPFLSLVATRGHATRRALDFSLPEIIRGPALRPFLILARGAAFDPYEHGGTPPLETLIANAERYQARVRRDLQHGVMAAIAALAHVNDRRASGRRTRGAARDEALTLVYRILFLLFAESRDLVPHRHPTYARAYAMSTLCRAAVDEGARGLWDALAAATRLARSGCRTDDLDVPAFNGALFARAGAPSLESRPRRRSLRGSTPRDEAAGQALRSLGFRPGAGRETICFRDLGVDQLGGIYESILDAPARRGRHSAARKRTGTFYTPQPLTDFVVRRTLAPLVSGATADRILALRIVDPAMGSGAFLVSACRYLASAYEHALVDEGRANAADFGADERASIRRLVAERCLAGVDRNPTAVQLARLSLWLTTMASGKPLSFLDHRLRVGDSLLGAWPADLTRLPARRDRRHHALPLFDDDALDAAVDRAAPPLRVLLTRPGDTVEAVRAKEAVWRRMAGIHSPFAPWRDALDLWCARWCWPPSEPPAPDAAELRALVANRLSGERTLRADHVAARMRAARAARGIHAFFHWPIEFPDVFYDIDGAGRAPGFDATIGNPPWEMVRADPRDAEAGADDDVPAPDVHDHRHLLRFVRECGAYPSCGTGHLNLYQPFVDRAFAVTRTEGRIGLVLPWGLAADDGAAALRARLLDESRLDAFVGFDNADGIFPIHRGTRFLVVVTRAGARTVEFRARCGVRRTSEIETLPDIDLDASSLPVRLARETLAAVGGPARRLPDIRRAADAGWLSRIATAAPRLGSEAGWAVTFGRELNATESRRHVTPDGLPIVEGKHIAPFSVAIDPNGARVRRDAAVRLLRTCPFDRPRLAYRDVASAGNRQSLIAAIVPAGCVTTHTLFCLRNPIALERQWFLCALFNSYVLNALVRAVMGGHVTTSIVESLPVPVWSGDAAQRRLAAMAASLEGPADAARLQALVARLYGLTRVDFDRILETFPLVPAAEREDAARYFSG